MAYTSERTNLGGGLSEIHVINDKHPDVRHLAYEIDSRNQLITFFPYPNNDNYLSRIEIRGFANLPEEFSDTGYIAGGIQYYIDKKCREANITDCIISRNDNDQCRNFRGGISRLILSYASFQSLKFRLSAITNEAKRERSLFTDDFFHNLFPNKFDVVETSTNIRKRRLIENLDADLVSEFTPSEILALQKFYSDILERRYVSIPHKLRLVNSTKLKVDSIALETIIIRFEEFLADNSKSEADWGGFLKENIFIIDSKYVKVLPEVILTMVRARRTDFGLLDYNNYFDIFEIKKPTTHLLSPNTDRDNYYWHIDTVKAIMQAEKYLHVANTRADVLQADLRRQAGFENAIILKPTVNLVIGNSNQLDTLQKKEDFKILRSSLRNVNIILYDELLERIKLQRERNF